MSQDRETRADIITARKAMTAAAEVLVATVKKAYPLKTRLKVTINGKSVVGFVIGHGDWFTNPGHIGIRNETSRVEQVFNAAAESCDVKILPAVETGVPA